MKNVYFTREQFCQGDNNTKNIPMREAIISLLCIVFVLATVAAFGHWEMQRDTPVTARFTDNNDGTVTDNTTGLIWLKNANCFGRINWYEAITGVADLAHGQCGLADGSSQGDWRLPEKAELLALLDERYEYPALSNAANTGPWAEGDPFSGVQTNPYWSATAYENYSDAVWLVRFSQDYTLYYANNSFAGKTGFCYVWPVRVGQ